MIRTLIFRFGLWAATWPDWTDWALVGLVVAVVFGWRFWSLYRKRTGPLAVGQRSEWRAR